MKPQHFNKTDKLSNLQKIIGQIYDQPDDRFFSLWDILSNIERFTMRALKGIRKNDRAKVKINLLVTLSWSMSFANRLHINLEKKVWERFPNCCSYCASRPCQCQEIKAKRRKKVRSKASEKPKTLAAMQKMFSNIYPVKSRNLEHAGIHLAEEMGELSEAVQIFLGEHKNKQFSNIEDEAADYVSCLMGVANSANIDLAAGLARMFRKNCHVCHEQPCQCDFSFIADYKS